ncbi:Purine efflux pump PbuE [compost metagenome]
MNRLAIYLLAIGAFITGTAEFVVSGILELIASDLQISIAAAGQLITIYSISYAVGALVLVMVTARYERKKVLVYSLMIFIAGSILAFINVNFALLMLSRIVMAASGGLYTVVATSYAARLAPPQQQGRAIATVITGFSISLVLGVPFGTLLSVYMDWRYIYLFLAIAALVNAVLLQKYIPKFEGSVALTWKEQWLLLRDPRVLTGLLTTVLWILGYTMVFAYIAPLLSSLMDFSLEMISSSLLILGIAALIGSRLGGYAVDRWGPARTIIVSLTLHATALFLLKSSTVAVTTLMLFAILLLWGAATWTTTPANQYYLITLQPRSSEIILSLNTALMNMGMALGAASGGIVIEYAGIEQISGIAGSIILLAILTSACSLTLNARSKRGSSHSTN